MQICPTVSDGMRVTTPVDIRATLTQAVDQVVISEIVKTQVAGQAASFWGGNAGGGFGGEFRMNISCEIPLTLFPFFCTVETANTEKDW
jgi:hypothetical protein